MNIHALLADFSCSVNESSDALVCQNYTKTLKLVAQKELGPTDLHDVMRWEHARLILTPMDCDESPQPISMLEILCLNRRSDFLDTVLDILVQLLDSPLQCIVLPQLFMIFPNSERKISAKVLSKLSIFSDTGLRSCLQELCGCFMHNENVIDLLQLCVKKPIFIIEVINILKGFDLTNISQTQCLEKFLDMELNMEILQFLTTELSVIRFPSVSTSKYRLSPI